MPVHSEDYNYASVAPRVSRQYCASIDGETASINLHQFVEDHQELLSADGCMWEFGRSRPSHHFVHVLGLPVATAHMGYPDTKTYAPNEDIRVDLYLKHAGHMARLLKEFTM